MADTVNPNVFNVAGAVNPLTPQNNAGYGMPGGASNLLENPLFLSFMADLGARMDPNGFAGAVGGATKSAIQAQAVSKALGKTAGGKGANMAAIIKALGDPNSGLTGAKFDPETGALTSLTGTSSGADSSALNTPSPIPDTSAFGATQKTGDGKDPLDTTQTDDFFGKFFKDLGITGE
jgi:hypothetical protein